jgi:hypothetical protein
VCGCVWPCVAVCGCVWLAVCACCVCLLCLAGFVLLAVCCWLAVCGCSLFVFVGFYVAISCLEKEAITRVQLRRALSSFLPAVSVADANFSAFHLILDYSFLCHLFFSIQRR